MKKHPLFQPIDSPLAREFLLEGGRRGILLVHGFTATPSQMLPLGRALNAEGYTVLGPLLPGHGSTIEEMEATKWSDWLRAARDAFNALARKCDDITVIGLSMGGILSLILAEELPVKACVSIAAPMRLKNRLAYLSPVAWPFLRYNGWPKDPDGERKENEYHTGYAVTPVRKIPDLLRLERMAERGLPNIACPLLVVQPGRDDTVRQDSPRVILSGAENARWKEFLALEESRHVCTVEPEFEKLFGEISRFLQEAHAE